MELNKVLAAALVDKGMAAYEQAVIENRSSGDPYRTTRAGVHAAMWEAWAASAEGIAQAIEVAAPDPDRQHGGHYGGMLRAAKVAREHGRES